MTPLPSSPAAPAALRRRHSLLRRALVTQVACVAIAGILTGMGPRQLSFTANWVYACAIGTSSWLFIDGGRNLVVFLLSRHPASRGWVEAGAWPGSALMGMLVVLGAMCGYTVGTAIGDAYSGRHLPSLLDNPPAMIITLLCSVAATWYFFVSEKLHQTRAAADSARRLALENQLRLLESQLEPHMLFNTLANLRVLIGLDPPRAQAMLDRLIAFLRATFEASHERMHPLATEFERLADYLQLMAVRMGPRLRFTLDLPDALRAWPIPPLLLQPLVENAIKHGLEPQLAGGAVRVSAARHGGRLCIEVRDTGVGFGATAPSTRGTQFGTRHVAERLQAVYGAQARFELRPADDGDGGTLARIELPEQPPDEAPTEPATERPNR